MSLAEGILWLQCALLVCYGSALIARGLRGEGLRRMWARCSTEAAETRYHPALTLVGLGLGALMSGVLAGWFAGELQGELSLIGAPSPITPWQIGSAGVLVLGMILLTHAAMGDRSKGRKRCPKCWYDMSSAASGPAHENDGRASKVRCPECGLAVSSARKLLRTRRSRARLAAGFTATALGLAVLVWLNFTSMIRGAVALAPDRVVIEQFFQRGGRGGDILTDEIVARLDTSTPRTDPSGFAATYVRLWLANLETNERTRSGYLIPALTGEICDQIDEESFTESEILDAYLTVNRVCVPLIRRLAAEADRGTWPDVLEGCFTVLPIPDALFDANYPIPHGKAGDGRFEDLNERREAVRARITTRVQALRDSLPPSGGYSLDPTFLDSMINKLSAPRVAMYLILPRDKDRFCDHLVNRYSNLTKPAPSLEMAISASVISEEALSSAKLRDDLLRLLESENQYDREFALAVFLNLYPYRPGSPKLEPDAEHLAVILDCVRDPIPSNRFTATRILISLGMTDRELAEARYSVVIELDSNHGMGDDRKYDFQLWLEFSIMLARNGGRAVQYGLATRLPDVELDRSYNGPFDYGTPEERRAGFIEILEILVDCENENARAEAKKNLENLSYGVEYELEFAPGEDSGT